MRNQNITNTNISFIGWHLKWILSALLLACFIFFSTQVEAQNRAYIIKGGLSMATQSFNGSSDRDIRLGGHGAFAVETADEDEKYSFFGQLGFHQRGSALVFFANQGNNLFNENITIRNTFNNLALILGGKQRFDLNEKIKYYYALGVRGDYVLNYEYLNGTVDIGNFVNRMTLGVTFALGAEYKLTEFISPILEFSVHPDVTRQVFLPQQRLNNGRILQEQDIRNVTFELTLGFRFLHKIEYID